MLPIDTLDDALGRLQDHVEHRAGDEGHAGLSHIRQCRADRDLGVGGEGNGACLEQPHGEGNPVRQVLVGDPRSRDVLAARC